MNSIMNVKNFDEEYLYREYLQAKNHVSIQTDDILLPIEITIVGKLPHGSGKGFLESAFKQQSVHPTFIDEYNEPSALIGKTNFANDDPTAIYTFGVDTRDLVFHRHAGHRVITGITGTHGCKLKFSLCTPEEAVQTPAVFFEKMYLVNIPADRMFTLRFSGTIYHQFCPNDYSEKAFFAVSVHTNEANGLSGALLEKVLVNEASIPLLTEPAPDCVVRILNKPIASQYAKCIDLDIDDSLQILSA